MTTDQIELNLRWSKPLFPSMPNYEILQRQAYSLVINHRPRRMVRLDWDQQLLMYWSGDWCILFAFHLRQTITKNEDVRYGAIENNLCYIDHQAFADLSFRFNDTDTIAIYFPLTQLFCAQFDSITLHVLSPDCKGSNRIELLTEDTQRYKTSNQRTVNHF